MISRPSSWSRPRWWKSTPQAAYSAPSDLRGARSYANAEQQTPAGEQVQIADGVSQGTGWRNGVR